MPILKHMSLQDVRLYRPLTRAVFHKALPAKAKGDLRDAPAKWCGNKDLQSWALGGSEGSPALGLSYRQAWGRQGLLKGREKWMGKRGWGKRRGALGPSSPPHAPSHLEMAGEAARSLQTAAPGSPVPQHSSPGHGHPRGCASPGDWALSAD